MHIPVVDIFAGPGGLGEGFSSFTKPGSAESKAFKIGVSAEMEPNAARTLRLRAFFRMFAPGHVPDSYYNYVAGRCAQPWTAKTKAAWHAATEEALQLELGQSDHDALLYERIRQTTRKDQPWVLIGGPPCQAYSLVGRARNKGIASYRAEADARHYLYLHYLRIIQQHQPAAFVMENVKGILSSRVNGEMMFPRILEDLSRPGGATGPRYKVIPLLAEDAAGTLGFHSPEDFILRAEELGVPQARHRVVLFGVAEGISLHCANFLAPKPERFSVGDVLAGLPQLRSGLTDRNDEDWPNVSSSLLEHASRCAEKDQPLVAAKLRALATRATHERTDPGSGGRWLPKTDQSDAVPKHLSAWLLDNKLDGILNHEVRNHMSSDLTRYAYASTFAAVHQRSPRGSEEFPDELHPSHKNWASGKFVDRFKVQVAHLPSSTVTSHLSKDGHYFIHPDPAQLRSLSVREAARLQTFPDNYFFEGSRGAQYRQVGNAVPPWLAHQVAATVYSVLA